MIVKLLKIIQKTTATLPEKIHYRGKRWNGIVD